MDLKHLKELIITQPFIAAGTFFALASAVGSMYFSEIVKLVPCQLCWYQRIFMFPLAWLLPVGFFRKDKYVYTYILPVAITGWLIAAYHNYEYYYANFFYNGANETLMVACSGGISCVDIQLEWLGGLISIPSMSFAAYSAIIIAMYLQWQLVKKESK